VGDQTLAAAPGHWRDTTFLEGMTIVGMQSPVVAARAAIVAALTACGKARVGSGGPIPAGAAHGGVAGVPLDARTPCPDQAPLPAYAHNDYENRRPLHDALRLGFAGAEADLVFVDGALLVAHGRRGARPGRTLEALYLRPLRDLVKRCGTVLPAPRAFLLNIEVKERSPAAYDSLVALLGRYPDVVGAGDRTDADGSGVRPVEVVLVGWHPPLAELARRKPLLARVQQKLTSADAATPEAPEGLVRLVSLDYGKTMGRERRGSDRWLAALTRARAAGPERLARVYNAPVRRDVYAALLAAGVDLIGTEDLAGTRRELDRLLAIDRRAGAP
jgi:hypothetical protein